MAAAPTRFPKNFSGFLVVLGRALYGILTAVFVLGYLGRYIDPQRFWWPQLFALVLPGTAVCLLVATVFVVPSRRRVLLVSHVFVMSLVLFRFIPVERLVRQTQEKLPALNVTSFNIRVGRFVESADTLLDDARIWANVADIICLQDAEQPASSSRKARQRTSIVNVLVDSLDFFRYSLEPTAAGNARQTTLSRFGIIRQTETVLAMGPEDESATGVVHTVINWQGQDIAAYNLHLRTFGNRKPWRKEDRCGLGPSCWMRYLSQYREAFLARALEARQISEMLGSESLPFIVCGDFNSTPHHWVYSCLSDGLQDAFRVAGRGWGATYPSQFPLARIDFVLASPQWKVISAHVPNAGFSDHRPVVATLVWRQP